MKRIYSQSIPEYLRDESIVTSQNSPFGGSKDKMGFDAYNAGRFDSQQEKPEKENDGPYPIGTKVKHDSGEAYIVSEGRSTIAGFEVMYYIGPDVNNPKNSVPRAHSELQAIA